MPPLIDGPARWNKVFIQYPGYFGIRMTDDSPQGYTAKYDAGTLAIRLRKIDPSKFPLLNRGFHWINEYPFNR